MMSTRHKEVSVPKLPPERPSAPAGLTWRQQIGAILAYGLIRAIGATLRYRMHFPEPWRQHVDQHQVIFAIWHNRLTLSLITYQKVVRDRNPRRRLAAMVSLSRDGGLMARILHLFVVQPVRGSTSRRGAQALIELSKAAERGYDLALTPDGPRGPRYVLQPGVISLAQHTGHAIVPVSYSLNWKLRVNSWDRHLIPLPFSRCDIYVGEPITIPHTATEPEREALRARVEAALLAITRD